MNCVRVNLKFLAAQPWRCFVAAGISNDNDGGMVRDGGILFWLNDSVNASEEQPSPCVLASLLFTHIIIMEMVH